MLFGLTIFPTDYTVAPGDLGRAAEAAGFQALLFAEHTHIPTSRETPPPPGGELPRRYWHTLDPFVACTAVAAATTTLRMGTGICLVVERDPITLAKEVASVDHLSGGRVLFGIGGGWNHEEMENHGTRPATRWKVLRERVLAMKRIWTDDDAEFHGRYVDFDPVWSWPKPVQKPHPPILVGGDGARTLQRVIEYGDEWMPIAGRGSEDLGARIEELQRMARDAGRGSIPVSLFGARPQTEAIEKYEQAGVSRCILPMPSVPRDEAISRLKHYAELMK